MPKKYILSIDQGTTGTTVFVFDNQGKPVGKTYQEFTQYYPKPGWVEHDAEEIWNVTIGLVERAILETKVTRDSIAAIGVTNQRETTVLWDRKTGVPVGRAIVWQCRRTAGMCDRLKNDGHADVFRRKTGLVIDPYFSGTKIKWLLDSSPELRRRAEAGELAFGTIDSWLLWKLTGGKVHVTDYSNASRTLLFNLHTLSWDAELLSILGIPPAILPEVKSSSEVYGHTVGTRNLPAGIPIAGIAGDQQAALFGQACYEPGAVKATFGTGSFILMNTGSEPVPSENGLLTTIAWGLGGKIEYALEGSVFMAGATIQWLRDELKLIYSASQTEQMALSVPDTNGVYFVPAFVGLGAPHWDSYARGAMVGLTRGANRNHIARAALEAIAYQTKDVIDVMSADSGIPVVTIKVDGGASVNNFLIQFLSDMLQVDVFRPQIFETTALGAAFLAGLAVGVWKDTEDIQRQWQPNRKFTPHMTGIEKERLYGGWKRAVERSKGWVIDEE